MLPCDRDGLWAKAKAFANRSFAARDVDDFHEAALWAANALELLGKSALAKVSPLLIADPQDDGRSLLIAAGLVNDIPGFKSVPAKAIFSRCARAFPPFNKDEAVRIAASRNAELHSALSPFAAVDEELWWQRFWSQAVVLVHAQGATLEDLVGTARERVVEAHLARNAENVARRYQAMIESARKRYTLAKDSHAAQSEIATLVMRWSYEPEYNGIAACPACGNEGNIYAEVAGETELVYDPEDGTATEYLTAYADFFLCPACGLHLNGSEFIELAGLPTNFAAEREYDPGWDDYGND